MLERKEKLSKLKAARLAPSVADRVATVAQRLDWTESQVFRWCVKQALPNAEKLRIK